MMETDSPSKVFLGVHFVLFGFDPLTKNKVKSKLVSGGGVDAGQYNENCTHVIVDKVVYDDPICVAARNDGKTVVTGLWVDHSFDIGMPVDATSVMYQPLRDLNGIPGAKNLILCLTGYQRQDRDDIMTMVGLMGAQFSKPLVANKVTHLICYKFEGEKYELANKMRKIKLVNHRWLEDCLKDWKLLPEDNYEKSGYELEMMEAEAKDSEEEAEGPGVKQSSSENAYRSPHNLKGRTPSGCALPKSTGEAQKVSNNLREPEGLSSIVGAKDVLTTPGRSRADHASSFDTIRISEVSGYLDAGGLKDAASFELPEPQYKTPISTKTGNDLESVSRSAERQYHSDAKYSAVSYTRKTPRRSPSSIFSGHSGDIRGSPKSMLGQSIDMSSAKVEYANDLTSSPCAVELIDKEASSCKKQKTDVSCSSFRSQKINHDAQACVTGSPSVTNKSGGLEPPSLVDDLSKIDNNSPFRNHGYSVHNMISMNAAQNSHTNVSAAKSSKFRQKLSTEDQVLLENMTLEAGQNQKANTKTPEPSFSELREDNLARHDSGFFVAERSGHIIVEAAEPQNLLQDGIPSPPNRKSETEKSDSLSNLNVLQVGNDNSITKPAGKKMVSKKTLGSRPKLTSKANQKGSIYLNASSAQIDPADDLTGGKESAENESFTNANEIKTSSASVKVTAANMETELATRSGDNIENKIDFMDDETEAPEEKDDCDNLLGRQQAEVIGMTHNADNKREMILEGTYHGADKSPTCVHDGPVEGKNEVENAVELQNKDRSTSSEDSVKRTRPKDKRQLSGKTKTKTKTVPPVRKAESKKVQDVEESSKKIEEKAAEKENAEPHPAGKAKSRIVSKKKFKSSAEAEKENKLAVDADQSVSQSEDHVGKTIAKYNETTMRINQKSRKSKPTSTPCGEVTKQVKTEPLWFILSGHRLQRKEFQQVIRRLKGKFCRDSHQWSYQATHFIAPDPIRRTEKFFAAAASGRWVLKTDYLAACSQAGSFLAEEPYEWHKKGLSEDGAINLEAPRKWRLLRERTGHGAFYGMRIIIYGECITPPLDTLKRVVKAGDGTILATSPPYTRFLTSGVDYAVVSPGMLRVDVWVQEFLKHKIPCVVADYLVEYVCKPGYSLEKHVLYNTNEWAENSFSNLSSKAEEIVADLSTSNDCSSDDVACEACGFRDRAEVMLICGDECSSVGCGVGMHIDCCNPPLENIPKEDWFCPKCSGMSTSTIPSTSPPKKRTKKASSRKAK